MSFVSFVGNYVPCETGKIRENIEVEVNAKTLHSNRFGNFLSIDPQYKVELAIFCTLRELWASTACPHCDS